MKSFEVDSLKDDFQKYDNFVKIFNKQFHLSQVVEYKYNYWELAIMQFVLQRLQSKESWKQAMRKTCRQNKLSIEIVSYFTPLRIRAAYSKFKKTYEKKDEHCTNRWLQNELKAFYWMCVAVSCIQQTFISQFKETEWSLLNSVFDFKNPDTLQYEGKKLMEEKINKNHWTAHEEQLLSEIVMNIANEGNKWNQVARKLFAVSQKRYFRSGKQVRERWLNHLDPSIKHGGWTQQEEYEVARLFMTQGCRWSQIAKKLGGNRTEHMIKNRYKTIIAKQKKSHPEIKRESTLISSFLDHHPLSNQRTVQFFKIQQNKKQVQNKVAYNFQVFKETQIKPEPSEALILPVKELKQEENRSDFDSDVQNIVQVQDDHEEQHRVHPLLQNSMDYLHSVYSPWYLSYPITPTSTFSPTFSIVVNIPTFSTFENSLTQRFYCPKPDQ